MKFGLLGRKLKHSFSPQIHAHFYDASYDLFEIEPQDVSQFMQNFTLDGMNVTIPYKKDVIPFCSELSETAKKIGSVNTIVRRRDGSLYGDNSDYYGFSYMVQKSGVSVAGKKAVILGSGGSSLTVWHVLHDLGAKEIVVISRSGENNYENISRHFDAEIIVNTTPVGMYPETGKSAIDIASFLQAKVVFDLIYNPAKTKLLLDAEALGIPAYNGLSMLVAQAKKSAEVFTNSKIEDNVIDKITDILSAETKNIMLIGMPGCGKSTVGKALASLLCRDFFDTDPMILEKTGKTPADMINEQGEAAFRAVETEILTDISKQSGKVIATGGGIVTQTANYLLAKQNSVVIFINRPLAELETKDRPLSQSQGVQALYEHRLPLYRKFADYTVKSCGVTETAQQIKEILGL